MYAATVGDETMCAYTTSHCVDSEHDGNTPGIIKTGASKVMINGRPAARVGDLVDETTDPMCTVGTGIIASGSDKVFIEGKPAARMGDIVSPHTDIPGTITKCASKVIIG